MRLKDKNTSPIGGFYYIDPNYGRVPVSGGFETLVRRTEEKYLANGANPPDNLREIIEDQICMRQPPDRCWYSKGLGDRISKVVHAVAGVVDKVAGTQLQQRARGCKGCGRRRNQLNAR